MKYSSIFPALLDININDVPVFIPTFNQPSLLKMTLDQFASYKHGPIIVCDNNSTYPPMIEYLNQIENTVSVIYSSQNTGPRFLTEETYIVQMMPEYFIVTDPDLIHNKNLPSDYINEMKLILDQYPLAKVGFALEINDEEEINKFQDFAKVYEWESPYWQKVIGETTTSDTIYNAYIDTTFSLNHRNRCLENNRQGRPTFRYPAARIAGKYTCQHVGWWKKEIIPQPDEEKQFYLNNQKWSHTENYYYR